MAFTEKQEYKIEVLENGTLQIRRADIVCKDGAEVGRQYHRHVLFPGDDVSEEIQRVQDVANATWTPEVVTAYEERVAATVAQELARNENINNTEEEETTEE